MGKNQLYCGDNLDVLKRYVQDEFPSQKQVAAKGIDGGARFPLAEQGVLGKVLVSAKGGKTITPSSTEGTAPLF